MTTHREAVRSVRPRLAVAWTGVLLVAALVLQHPATLAGLLVGICLLGRHLGAGRELWRILRLALVFAAVLFAVQVLVDRNGLTVLLRLGQAGPLGQLDITLEAVCGAASQALRVLCGLAVSALGLALVDVDRVLGSVRRRAPRLGVTATLALRLAPALAGDGRRYADGLRARADGGALAARDRALVVTALVSRTLDRAGDAAGILELRGLGRPQRGDGAPRPQRWSGVERAAATGALLTTGVTLVVRLLGADRFDASPLLHGSPASAAALAGLLIAAATGLPLAVATHEPRFGTGGAR